MKTIDTVVNALVKSIQDNRDIIFKGMFEDISSNASPIVESETKNETPSMTYQNMGAVIIEAILQAGMNYERAVKPRVTKFLKDYSEMKNTSEFLKLIKEGDLENVINWKGDKISRIIQLTEFLATEGLETEKDFSIWLKNDLNTLRLKNTKGIKDKTVDYLKILCGHKDTVAIDLHLMNFIKENTNLGIDLSYTTARQILISTAERIQV